MSARAIDLDSFGPPEEAVVFLGNMLEASTEYAVVALDAEGRIVSWNEGARRLYGYEPAEIVGRPDSVLHSEETVYGLLPERVLANARSNGKWEGTVEHRRNDGSGFTARVVKTCRRDVRGGAGGFLLISSDITDDVRLTQELERTRAFASSLLECAPDAMVIVDSSSDIQSANAETEKLFGYPREELLGRPVEMLIPQRYHAHHARADPELEHTRVVAVTASAMLADRERIAAAGFDGYIQKPIDPETFVEQVERCLAMQPVARSRVVGGR